MTIKNLRTTDFHEIVQCLVASFENYFVPMPSDAQFWHERFKASGVNYVLSYGAFVNNKLVGFIINNVDKRRGVWTAYNGGTGVLPAFRGQQIVDKIYAYALPYLKKTGIQKCQLEVIQQNKRAIRVYERIGFKIVRDLRCFKGVLKKENKRVNIKRTPFQEIIKKQYSTKFTSFPYAWDNDNETIINAGKTYATYLVSSIATNESIGYFVINKYNSYIPQMEADYTNFPDLMNGIAQITQKVRINNVDARRQERIKQMAAHGFVSSINQFEMEIMI